jgi:hypothetical protein
MNARALQGAAAVGGLGMNIAQMAMTKRAQQRDHAFQKHAYQNRYQWAFEDMEKAGLNPVLAFSGAGASGAPTLSGGGAGTFQQADLAGAAKKGGELSLIERQGGLLKAQTSAKDAEKAYYEAMTAKLGRETDRLDQMWEEAEMELRELRADPEIIKKRAQTKGIPFGGAQMEWFESWIREFFEKGNAQDVDQSAQAVERLAPGRFNLLMDIVGRETRLGKLLLEMRSRNQREERSGASGDW